MELESIRVKLNDNIRHYIDNIEHMFYDMYNDKFKCITINKQKYIYTLSNLKKIGII